jgi:dihydrofolate synthase/folylpolyglutamate synthase
MALYHFGLENVDWAVLETGMGGRHDATNLVHPQVSVISNINMEHSEYLGNTLAKIAAEKAGIIKRGAGVVTGTRQKGALQVIGQAASRKGVPLYRIGKEIRTRKDGNGSFTYLGLKHRWPRLKVGLCGDHQTTNGALALAALELLMEKGLRASDEAIYSGLEATRWPGRLEVVSEDPVIVLDGAHNPSAARALKEFLETWEAPRPLVLVIGILKDKAWKAMLRIMLPLADRVILTRPEYERAADPEFLASFARSIKKDVVVISRLPDAISLALKEAGPGHTVCITGSLYTVGEAKAYLEGTRRQ